MGHVVALTHGGPQYGALDMFPALELLAELPAALERVIDELRTLHSVAPGIGVSTLARAVLQQALVCGSLLLCVDAR
jgi:hypothetical protein